MVFTSQNTVCSAVWPSSKVTRTRRSLTVALLFNCTPSRSQNAVDDAAERPSTAGASRPWACHARGRGGRNGPHDACMLAVSVGAIVCAPLGSQNV